MKNDIESLRKDVDELKKQIGDMSTVLSTVVEVGE